MRKVLWLSLSIGIIAAVPATAEGTGGTTGACWIEFLAGNQEAAECIEDVTQSDCESFCSNCSWSGGTACTDLKYQWEGSCFFDEVPPGGGCWLWVVEPGANTAEFHCEQTFGGTWFENLECSSEPVPTLPRAGRAALFLVLLMGALVALSFHSRGIAG